MISQRCPKCGSKRIRRGYRPTRIWSKLFFRYNLLCDSCNWEFTGFAVPGTVSTKPKKYRKSSRRSAGEKDSNIGRDNVEEENVSAPVLGMKRKKIKKTFVL